MDELPYRDICRRVAISCASAQKSLSLTDDRVFSIFANVLSRFADTSDALKVLAVNIQTTLGVIVLNYTRTTTQNKFEVLNRLAFK